MARLSTAAAFVQGRETRLRDVPVRSLSQAWRRNSEMDHSFQYIKVNSYFLNTIKKINKCGEAGAARDVRAVSCFDILAAA